MKGITLSQEQTEVIIRLLDYPRTLVLAKGDEYEQDAVLAVFAASKLTELLEEARANG